MGNGYKVIEGIFTIVFVGLVLGNAPEFVKIIKNSGGAYGALVKGLQGR